MAGTGVFNSTLFSAATLHQLQQEFSTGQPIRHLVIDNLLEESVARTLFEQFPSMDGMQTRYNGINEKKAEHGDFRQLHPSFSHLHEVLSSDTFIAWLQSVTGIQDLETIEDRLGYGLHQGANNSFLDIHIDYNIHPFQKLYRKLNFILFLNPEWKEGWGGHLELWDKDVKNCIQSIAPIFNRCVIFECSNVSYHGYDRITVPEHITRKSLYQYYFVPLSGDLKFHDTIFRPRPQESMLKAGITYIKDFAKNTVKKTFVTLGWKKFLK